MGHVRPQPATALARAIRATCIRSFARERRFVDIDAALPVDPQQRLTQCRSAAAARGGGAARCEVYSFTLCDTDVGQQRRCPVELLGQHSAAQSMRKRQRRAQERRSTSA
jgi:hypothetical protein